VKLCTGIASQVDAVVADGPSLLMDEGFHTGWANTRALDASNITRDTPDPMNDVMGQNRFRKPL